MNWLAPGDALLRGLLGPVSTVLQHSTCCVLSWWQAVSERVLAGSSGSGRGLEMHCSWTYFVLQRALTCGAPSLPRKPISAL